MDVTTILAIVGVATGLTGTVLSVLNYRRDRAVIKLDSSVLVDTHGSQFVIVEVRNEGRHGVTLTGLGILVVSPDDVPPHGVLERLPLVGDARRTRRLRNEGAFYDELNALVDDSTDGDYEPFLKPGHKLRIKIRMAEMHGRTSGDREAWPCAEDFTGETFLGEQAAHVQEA